MHFKFGTNQHGTTPIGSTATGSNQFKAKNTPAYKVSPAHLLEMDGWKECPACYSGKDHAIKGR